jgi:four helix bundle protein
MSNRLEDLEIYSFSDKWFVVLEWDYFAKDTLGKQLVRAADSIGAKIAEGFGKYHYKENKNFCYFSRGSLTETKGWLNKAHTRKLISGSYTEYLTRLNSIYLKLNSHIKNIGEKVDRSAIQLNGPND